MELSCNEDNIEMLFEDEGLQWTNNPRDAVYLLPDGRMISAHSIWQPKSDKSRDVEHRIIFNTEETQKYRDVAGGNIRWKDVLSETGWIQLIPETKAIIQISDATEQQKEVLDEIKDYDIFTEA